MPNLSAKSWKLWTLLQTHPFFAGRMHRNLYSVTCQDMSEASTRGVCQQQHLTFRCRDTHCQKTASPCRDSVCFQTFFLTTYCSCEIAPDTSAWDVVRTCVSVCVCVSRHSVCETTTVQHALTAATRMDKRAVSVPWQYLLTDMLHYAKTSDWIMDTVDTSSDTSMIWRQLEVLVHVRFDGPGHDRVASTRGLSEKKHLTFRCHHTHRQSKVATATRRRPT